MVVDAIIKKVEDALLKAKINFDARFVENGIVDPSSSILFPKKYVDDFAKALEDVATIDKKPKFEGRSMTMFLAPKNN